MSAKICDCYASFLEIFFQDLLQFKTAVIRAKGNFRGLSCCHSLRDHARLPLAEEPHQRCNPYTRISNLNDILFPTWDGINSLISSDSFCVYRNSPGNYNVLAQGSGPAYAFSLTEGISQLPYTATWNDLNTTTNLSANVLLSNRTNTFTTNQSCNGGANNNATIELTITPAAINSVPQGIYSGTMTMIISQQ